MRLVLLAVLSASAASAQDGGSAAARAPVLPDPVRWVAVVTSIEHRVYVGVEALWLGGGVVEVWTWHVYAEPRRPSRGVAYDRVIALDRVHCRLRATAPVRVARYDGRVSVRSFMFPEDVGPFGWAPGSIAEVVGERVCAGADDSGL